MWKWQQKQLSNDITNAAAAAAAAAGVAAAATAAAAVVVATTAAVVANTAAAAAAAFVAAAYNSKTNHIDNPNHMMGYNVSNSSIYNNYMHIPYRSPKPKC